MAAYDDYIYVIYKCKDNCKTIFTNKNLKDMQRFTNKITSSPLWAQFCVREINQPYFDGFGCTRNSYNNITKFITANLDQKATQKEVDAIVADFAPDFIRSSEAHQLLDKQFSVDNPNSKFVAFVFKTTDVIFDSVIRFSSRGFWEEIKGY